MARNSKNIIRLVEISKFSMNSRNHMIIFIAQKLNVLLRCLQKPCEISMTHTVWLIRFILYNFLKHSRTDSSKRTVRKCLVLYKISTFAVVDDITWLLRHHDVINAIIHPSLLILFFRNFQKAYFCTDWNSWLVKKKWFFKILFPYFPFSLIIADS